MTILTDGRWRTFDHEQRAQDNPLAQTTDAAYQSKLSHTFKRVVGGRYRIDYACEYRLDADDNAEECEVQVMLDGSPIGNVVTRFGLWSSMSSQAYATYADEDQPVIEVRWRKNNAGQRTAEIRRARISIRRVGDVEAGE